MATIKKEVDEIVNCVSSLSNVSSSVDLKSVNPSVMIVQFKNGNLIPSKRSRLKFASYKKSGDNRERILVANSKRLAYVGSNFGSNLPKITSSGLKLCVLNKRRSVVKLYDADFFQLKPHLKGPNIIDVKSEKTYLEKSSDLTLAFGSKIQKKKINTNMKYNSSSMNSDTISDILNTMSQEPNALPNDNSVSSAIPPQNGSAANIDEVYDIYDIISKEEFEVLDSEAGIFLDLKANVIQQWKSENKFPSFVTQFLEHNLLSMSIYKAKLLCYLNYMFYFLKTTYADWKKKEPIPTSAVPEPFRQKIMESFTINKSMPMRLKDKLLAYALVLALKVNGYCINGNTFAASTRISAKSPYIHGDIIDYLKNKKFVLITTVAYALGCHISDSKSDGVKIIQLKLPLYKFQTLPKKRKK